MAQEIKTKEDLLIEDIDKTIESLHKIKDELNRAHTTIRIKQMITFSKAYANMIGRNGF